MEILNTIEAEFSIGLVVLGVLLIIIAVLLLLGAILESVWDGGAFGILLLVFAILLLVHNGHGTRHEVIIADPDYVIDATKYEIIDQRGDIIVIEERGEKER